MRENECGLGDIADLPRAGGDVLQQSPPLGEQGESALTQTAHTALELVGGAVVEGQGWPFARPFDRGDDADARALVSGIGQGHQPGGGRGVERAEHVGTGRGEIVHRSGFDLGDEEGEPVRAHDPLDIAAVGLGFAGVPEVDLLAFDAGGLLRAAIGGDDDSIQYEVEQAPLAGLFQGLVEVGGLAGEHGGALVDVAVGGGAGDVVVGGQAGGVGAVAEVAQDQDGLVVAGQRPRVRACAQVAAVSAQEAGEVADEFHGDVECGTIGDQRSLSGVRGFSSQIPLLPGAPFFCQAIGQLSLGVVFMPWCPDRPFTLVEITSVLGSSFLVDLEVQSQVKDRSNY